MQVFDTARLHLRPVGPDDETFYCGLYCDPVLMRHIAIPMSTGAAQRSFDTVMKQQDGSRLIWIITEKGCETGCGILGVFPKDDAAEVGVMLLPQAQARGFAAEVISIIAGVLFQGGRIRWLWARHAAQNTPAGALMRSLGFEPCAAERLPSDMPAGEVRWQLTREAWESIRGRMTLATARSGG